MSNLLLVSCVGHEGNVISNAQIIKLLSFLMHLHICVNICRDRSRRDERRRPPEESASKKEVDSNKDKDQKEDKV